MILKHLTSICLGLAIGSLSLTAAGVALTLDAKLKGIDRASGKTVYLAKDDKHGASDIPKAGVPHVTLIYFDVDRSKPGMLDEVDRFLKAVKPVFPEMISRALAANGVKQTAVNFVNAKYSSDLFNNGKGAKGYLPGPVSAKVFVSLNEELNAFHDGKWKSDKADTKAGAESFDKLTVGGLTKPGTYKPHMSVDGPCCYQGTQNPAASVMVYLDQDLKRH